MAKFQLLFRCSLMQRFLSSSNARVISCISSRSRENPVWNREQFPEMPKNAAALYCIEKSRKRGQLESADSGPFSLAQCMKEWSELTESQRKPYIDQQKLLSQKYEEFMNSMSEEERAKFIARRREYRKEILQQKLDMEEWKKDKREKGEVPRRMSGYQLFIKEKMLNMHIDVVSARQILKATSELWDNLSANKKMEYSELARVRYENDLKEYQETHPNLLLSKDEIPKKRTGWNLFMKEKLRNAVPTDSIDSRQAMKAVSVQWKALSEKEKMEYNEQALVKFEEAVRKFKTIHPGFNPVVHLTAPKKKLGSSIFVKETLQRSSHVNQAEVLQATKDAQLQWEKLSKKEKRPYIVLAEIQFNKRLKQYLKDLGLKY